MASNAIHIREMTGSDIKAVAALSAQLGYPISETDAAERSTFLNSNESHLVSIASRGDQVIGWCHTFLVVLLESAGYAELGGIVVDETERRVGVGAKLVSHAEAWARENGMERLRAYSGRQRSEAHEFYRKVGFTEHSPILFERSIAAGEERGDANS